MTRRRSYCAASCRFYSRDGTHNRQMVYPIGTPDEQIRPAPLMVDRDPLVVRIERLLAPVARSIRYRREA